MNREALVVGINSYPFLKKQKPGDLNLKAPVKDAEAIAEMLEKYGKFHVQRLPKTYNKEGKARFIPHGLVKINDLEKKIINLFNPPSKNEVPDVALLFFAGHGYLKEKGGIQEGFLATSDAQLKNEKYGISLNWLKQLLKNSPVKTQIVWLDCCFSGEFLNFQEADPGTGKKVNRCFITAARSFETSVEQIDGEQGVFTARLLKGLNPENSIDGWVTNYILADSIQKNMQDTAQAPVFHNSGNAIILTTNSPTKPVDERWQNTPPYRALSYFTEKEEDAVFFHGRTRLTDELIDRVRTNNFVAILGASGSGKSSLLRAGLLYQLKRGQKISGSDRWLYINPFTPTSTPLENLQKAIINYPPKSPLERGTLKAAPLERATGEDFEGSPLNKESGGDNDDPPKSPLERGTLKTPSLETATASDFEGSPLTQENAGDFEGSPLTQGQIEDSPLTKGGRGGFKIEGEKPENLTAKLIKFIESAEAEKVIMVIDQFEESFTLCETDEKRQEFFNCFLEALANESIQKKLCLILGMRADFLDQCSKYPGLATQIKEHQLLVTPLEKSEIEEAIKKPAELVGMGIEPGLVAQMTEDFLRNPGSLPLLQYTLDVLWKYATQGEEKSQYLTLATYRKLGGIKGTLTKRANEVFDSLSKEEKSVAKRIFLELVQPGEQSVNSGKVTDTRRRVILEYLPNEQHSLELLLEVSDKLADQNNRLITKDKSAAGTLLDVIHEELIRSWEKLRNWVEEYQEALPLERKIEADAMEWKKQGEKDDWLWREGQLIKAEEYVTKYGDMGLLDGFAYEFVKASQELRKRWEVEEKERKKREFEQEQKARRLAQRRNQILVIFSLLMSGVSAFALVQQKIAKHYSEVSLVRQLLSQAQVLRNEKGYIRSVLLGLESTKKIRASQEWLDSWWGKVVNKFSDGQLLGVSKNELDGAIRKGLPQLPDRLYDFQHQGKVLAVAFSPDGKSLATAGEDQTTRIWGVATRKPIATLNYKGIVKKVEFSPDGKTIVTISEDKTARLWDAATGKAKFTLEQQGINAVAFSPDSKTIATASDDKTAKVWDTATGKVKFTLQHQDIVNAVAFRPDGKSIGTASDDGTAKVGDAVTGKVKKTLDHQGKVNIVVFSPDSKTIATASNDNPNRYYTANFSDVASLGGGTTVLTESVVKAIAFSPDGETLAIASDDKTTQLFTPNNTTIANLKHQGNVNAIAFSPDSKIVAIASDDNTTELFDTATGNNIATLSHQGSVNAVAFSPQPNGKSPESHIIVTVSDDNTARLWDTAAGNGMISLNSEGSVNVVAFSPDGKTIATTTGNDDYTFRLLDAASGKTVTAFNYQNPISAIAFSPDGKIIASSSYDNTARLWDAVTGKTIHSFPHQDSVNEVLFSPDGKTVATASEDNTARLWNTETGKAIATLKHQNRVRSIAFSPDGKTIATGDWDSTARLWDAETGKAIATLNHREIVTAVAFSPDGKTIVTASDKTARLWDAATQKSIATLNHQNRVNAVTFSSDGKTIVTASDKTARLWDAATQKSIAILNHQNSVNDITFSPDSKTIATASDDQTARLWDAATGNVIATLNHRDRVYVVAFSPDGNTIATGSDSGTYFHQVMAEDLKTEACRRLGRNLTAEEWLQYMNSNLDKYEKTCPQLPVHLSLITEAKNQAKKEEIKAAISILKKAQELEPEIDLDPDTKAKETNPQIVANKFAAPGKVEEGQKLAQEGKIEEAISIFKQAQELEPEIDLNPYTENKETDPEVVAKSFAVFTKVEEGERLAKEGKIEEAISIFKQAQEWSPEIDLYYRTGTTEKDPEVVANKFFASAKVEEGKFSAKEGKIEEAISLYDAAQKLDSDVEIDADDWGELCRFGSLNNRAKDVMFACEKAVKLNPNNRWIRSRIMESRGLARALTGDDRGAIEDFQVLVDSLKDGEDQAKIEGWIETLKKGENPITEKVLKELK